MPAVFSQASEIRWIQLWGTGALSAPFCHSDHFLSLSAVTDRSSWPLAQVALWTLTLDLNDGAVVDVVVYSFCIEG